MSETEFEKRVRGLVAAGKMVGPDDVGQLLSMVGQERDRAKTSRAEGFAAAREKAQSLAQRRVKAYGGVAADIVRDIRAMQDEGTT